MSDLIDKLYVVHDTLREKGIPHAFGGAIALAYCVDEPRGTRDLDVNIFCDSSDAAAVLEILPEQVYIEDKNVGEVERDGQARLWWDGVPIDVFFNNIPLHDEVARGVIWVPLEGRQAPVIDCASLVVFKSLFDRTKDWADIEAVAEAAPGDIAAALRTLAQWVGEDHPAYQRLASI